MTAKFLLRFAPALLALFLLPACSTDDRIILPAAPKWQIPADASVVPARVVVIEARRLAPGAAVSASDASYTLVSRDWLDRYLAWTWLAARTVGLRYVPESFDCENFARLFIDIADKKAADAGLRAAPLLALVMIRNVDGTRHELVGVATDAGLFIIEPQPDAGPFRLKPLAVYQDRIIAVEFGVFNPQ